MDLIYYDSCPDCDSISIDVREFVTDQKQTVYEAICRECGGEWYDVEDDEFFTS